MQASRNSAKQPQKNSAQKLRSWRVSLIRKKGQVLGNVEAPSREVAEAAAVSAFSLTEEQRKRLVMQERA